MRLDRILYRAIVKENIEYDIISQNYRDREEIDELVEIMLDAICSTRPMITVRGQDMPTEVVKSRLLKLNSEHIQYVLDCLRCVTDPKGTILVECGHMLRKHGYQIKVLNTINFKKSHHYNPFMYIRSEKDILKLVNTIIANTKGEGDKSGEDFWVKAEKLYYQALIGYIWYEAPDEEKNFTTLLELINASEAREDDESFKNAVDLMFEDLAEREPDHFAVRQYAKYKLAAGVVCSKRLLNQVVGKSLRTHNLKS